VFDEVERRRADFGVVPVENSTEGAVNVTLDRLIDSDVVICGELRLDISQQLLSRAGSSRRFKRVLSHPQGWRSAARGSPSTCPTCPPRRVLSTALAAEMAAGDATIAAIASALAGELYGVPILRARVEDNPHNSTRFLVVGHHPSVPTGRDKTSILFRDAQ